ncbi:MAG: Hsp70 family protein [Planctomycetaceae bacterium]|nr:Hsp70 family protein [Planctomycetaceae bacterium]
MKQQPAVSIDLGTTYSCIASLNEHEQPVTIPNQEGELSTPSVVFFDGDVTVVGTEALRNAVAHPDRVIQHVKRVIGDSNRFWKIDGNRFSPVHVSALILRKLLANAASQLGEIREAVITVPAQFSDAQRHATILAGQAAGLDRIEMINEPVAAALCYVLGNEGLGFSALAVDQRVLVFDLGGGTLDLAIVDYSSNDVRVIAADGDLELGGLDWTQALVDLAAERFIADFGHDPRVDPESHQFLCTEAEQAKRSLSVRPRAAITVQHAGQRKTYQVTIEEFEERARPLVIRAEEVTRRILRDNGFGWAHVDVVLTTGGASRMPMIRESLKKLSGRTLNTSLSPDQSIAHGAAYYAGMLRANNEDVRRRFHGRNNTSRLAAIKQQSVNARGLGILVRDEKSGRRVPHYLIPPNCPLPVSRTHVFGTVVDRQTRVHVRIVESGAGPGKPHTVLGDCLISDLPDHLPEGTEVEVTISYDRNAMVHVSAREPKSGRSAETKIVRQDNLADSNGGPAETPPAVPSAVAADLKSTGDPPQSAVPIVHSTAAHSTAAQPVAAPVPRPIAPERKRIQRVPQRAVADPLLARELSVLAELQDPTPIPSLQADQTAVPVILCDKCGTPTRSDGHCPSCGFGPATATGTQVKAAPRVGNETRHRGASGSVPQAKPVPPMDSPKIRESAAGEQEFWDLLDP